MGGEKVLDFMLFCPKPGSPPHGRGKVVAEIADAVADRITPAQAGKRSSRPSQICCSWDHPRTGGEKLSNSTRNRSIMGLPPHRRGKGKRAQLACVESRITPAWAGKSKTDIRRLHGTGDHPCVGGEKGLFRDHLRHSRGSPPRERGKGVNIAVPDTLIGITPEWAGKRLLRPRHCAGG